MAVLRIVAIMALWWYAFGVASTYGAIWHSQVHPARNVTLQFADGNEETGDLRRNWDRTWALSHSDGSARLFERTDWIVMRAHPDGSGLDYWQMWRSWGPVVLVTWACGAFLAWPWVRRFIDYFRPETPIAN